MSNIKALADRYVVSQSTEDRRAILEDAEALIRQLKWTGSYRKTLQSIGVSYFASVNSSAKIVKGAKLNYRTLVLYLSASKNAGVEVCQWACTGCRLACLVESGHALLEKRSGKFTIAASRTVKTWVSVWNPVLAHHLLDSEVKRQKRLAARKGEHFACRPNGTSDLNWWTVVEANPDVQFYDYTKDPTRLAVRNYHLTFSFSTMLRLDHYRAALDAGMNIAIPVVASDVEAALALPQTYDMDETDLRFLDGKDKRFGILKVKKTDNTAAGVKNGFVLDLDGVKRLIAALA